MLADDRADTPRPWLPLALAALVLAALGGFGAVRLRTHADAVRRRVQLRIMQPNLQQDEKFNYAAKQAGDEPLPRAVRPRHRAAIAAACATSRI